MTSRKEINDRLTRVNIKGRDYIDVAQRVQGFWELYPEGRISTQMTADDGKRCVFRAEVYGAKDTPWPIATGHAYEVNNGRGVNATSYIENCETSAVGRALGMLGIGSTDSIASADEVNAAMQAQKAAKPAQKAAGTARKADKAEKAPSAQAREFARLKAVCAAYEASHPRPDAEEGWALAGVQKRPDLPPKDAPDEERAAWFATVADEFESCLPAEGAA